MLITPRLDLDINEIPLHLHKAMHGMKPRCKIGLAISERIMAVISRISGGERPRQDIIASARGIGRTETMNGRGIGSNKYVSSD